MGFIAGGVESEDFVEGPGEGVGWEAFSFVEADAGVDVGEDRVGQRDG